MNGGYSYVTIMAAADEPTRIEVSFHLDDSAWVRAYGLDEDRPQLTIRHGDVATTFAPTTGRITEDDVRMARELADRAALYAAGVERLKAEQDAREQTGTAA
jgi:uncharacterized small protein (DUF1192 family)